MPLSSCKKCNKVQKILKEWVKKKSHDKCWYYPELFNKLVQVFDIKVESLELPSKEEFDQGCKKYQDEIYFDKLAEETNKSKINNKN